MFSAIGRTAIAQPTHIEDATTWNSKEEASGTFIEFSMRKIVLDCFFIGTKKEYKAKKMNISTFSLIKSSLKVVKERIWPKFFRYLLRGRSVFASRIKRTDKGGKKSRAKNKIHADEFALLGGAQLAVEQEAVSAEHLIAITAEGIKRMAASPTTAILLPGVPFFLMQNTTAPARKLIDAGAAVALATDFNPGSSMTESQLCIMRLGVFLMNMTIEEAINAVTINAAYGINRQNEVGSLEYGKKMDLILCDVPNYPSLVYHFGVNPIKHVIKNGKVVVRDGRLV